MWRIIFCLFFLAALSNAQNFWQPTNGPNGGQVVALAVHPNGTVFAGTADSGIYRSTDNGLNWTRWNQPPSHNLFFFKIAINRAGSIFAGNNWGIYRSTDNGDSWAHVDSGFIMGSFRSLAIDTSDAIVLLSAMGGSFVALHRSTNNGTTWTRIDSNLSFGSDARGLCIHSSGYIFLSVQSISQQPGVYRSTDGGRTWALTLNSLAENIVFDSVGYIYASEFYSSGIHRSTNTGASWQQMSSALTSDGPVTSLAVNRARYIFAGTRSWSGTGRGVFVSQNRGNTWAQTNSGLSDLNTYSLAVGPDQHLWAGTQSGLVFRSINPTAGTNIPPWSVELRDTLLPNVGRTLTTDITFSSVGSFDPDGTIDSVYWYVNDVLRGTNQTLTYGFGPGTSEVTLVVRDNQGATDTSRASVTRAAFTVPVQGPVYAGLSLLGDNILYAVVTNDAVYRMDIDGNILYTLQPGGSVLSASSIAYDTTVYIASTDRNLYAFSRFGVPVWPALPLGGELSATPTIDSVTNRLYIGVSNRNFFAVDRTTGTVAWSYFANAPVRNSAVITSNRTLVFSTVVGRIYGFDLDSLPTPVTPAWTLSVGSTPGDSITSSFAVDGEDNLYFGVSGGRVIKVRIQEGAAAIVWQTITGSAVRSSPVIDARGVLYVGCDNGNLYSLDTSNGAVRWQFQSGAAIRCTPAVSNSGNVYFGNDANVWFGSGYPPEAKFFALDSTGAVKWSYVFPTTYTSISAPVLYHRGTVYIGLAHPMEQSVWRILAFFDGEDTVANSPFVQRPVWGTFQGNNERTGTLRLAGPTGVADNPLGVPAQYSLSQNYPNPFNPSTVIRYTLPATSRVTLKVYNLLGQEVVTLVNSEQRAGEYKFGWNANGMPSGVYFYQLSATGFIETKKLLLIK